MAIKVLPNMLQKNILRTSDPTDSDNSRNFSLIAKNTVMVSKTVNRLHHLTVGALT